MPNPAPSRELLAARDVAFDAAMSNAAVDQLDALLAPDFVYTHTAGQRQSRADFLAGVATRRGHATRRLSAISVEVHETLAITFGDLTISYQSGRADHYLRYVRIHRFDGDTWLTIWHRTFEAADRAPGAVQAHAAATGRGARAET